MRTLFFRETGSFTARSVGVFILLGVALAHPFSGAATTTITSALPLAVGDRKPTTGFQPITVAVSTMPLAMKEALLVEAEGALAADSMAVHSTAVGFMAVDSAAADSTEAVAVVAIARQSIC